MAEEAPEPSSLEAAATKVRRMSRAELAFREAVCPSTIPDDVPDDNETGKIALSDALMLDGWASVKRASLTVPAINRMSVKLGEARSSMKFSSTKMLSGLGISSRNITESGKRFPPEPPPPPEATEEVEAALEAARQRKSSVASEPTE